MSRMDSLWRNDWFYLGTTGQLSPGESLGIRAGERELLVHNLGGRFWVCAARCPRCGQPMQTATWTPFGEVRCESARHTFKPEEGDPSEAPGPREPVVYAVMVVDDELYVHLSDARS